ncbi:MAG: hypothetical protein EON58_04690 [Alphaproteobacteria bacterium]|nr:MAG: hypothetical protein EON58_04690 [Alphaproteobacteria bacterium]
MVSKHAWLRRHYMGLVEPRDGFEKSLAMMLSGWALYADCHWETYGSSICKDYVLGPCWESIGDGLRGVLNGELGRLDGGILSAFLDARVRENEGDDRS